MLGLLTGIVAQSCLRRGPNIMKEYYGDPRKGILTLNEDINDDRC